ncbi:MAG: hypothetical protein RTU92_01915 [Candidatus Thorarchaeota archaeon]
MDIMKSRSMRRNTYNSTNGISTGFYDFIDHDWAMYTTSGTLIAYNPQ